MAKRGTKKKRKKVKARKAKPKPKVPVAAREEVETPRKKYEEEPIVKTKVSYEEV